MGRKSIVHRQMDCVTTSVSFEEWSHSSKHKIQATLSATPSSYRDGRDPIDVSVVNTSQATVET